MPAPAQSWLVFSSGSDGLLRREPNRDACVSWAVGIVEGHVTDRVRYDEDLWVYTISWIHDGQMTVTICTELAAVREGFSITEAPLYPNPGRPWTKVERAAGHLTGRPTR